MSFQKKAGLAILVIVGAVGFYLLICCQNAVGAVIIAFLGGTLLGSFINWYAQPILEFAGIVKNNQHTYFLKVEKVSGSGNAEACEGFIFVDGADISNVPVVWSDNNERYRDIGGYMNLRLFKVEEEHYEHATIEIKKSLTFPSAKSVQGFAEIRKPYKDVIDKNLTVKIYAKKGKVPKPYVKKISDVIKEAAQDNSLDEHIMGTYR